MLHTLKLEKMFKFLGKIFNPKKLGDSIISGIDKSFLSKEESIDYFQKMLVLYEPYKLAQRILAIMFSSAFLIVHVITAITHFYYTLKDFDSASIVNLYKYNNDSLGTIVLIIISFYFAGGVLEGTVKNLKK